MHLRLLNALEESRSLGNLIGLKVRVSKLDLELARFSIRHCIVRDVIDLCHCRAISLNNASIGSDHEAQGLRCPDLERNILCSRGVGNL